LETVTCPLCGKHDFKTLLYAPDRFNLSAGEQFSVVACKACDFRFLNPRPTVDEISRYYEDSGYQPFVSTRSRLSLWDRLYRAARRTTLKRKRQLISGLKPPGRLLDIGCGTGEFLHEMKIAGWQVAGVEPDQSAVDFARQQYGVDVQTGSVTDLAHLPGGYDVVTLWHVLEHVHEPVDAIKAIAGLLKAGGLMLVAVPNIGSMDARHYGRLWVALDAPRHLSHFTPHSMRRLLQQTGLSLVKWASMPLDAFYNCLMSEFLAAKVKQRSTAAKLMMAVRGMAVASCSALSASNLRKQSKRNGSSILYFIEKRG